MKLVIYLFIWVFVFVVGLFIGARNGQLVEFNYLIAMGEFKLSTLLGLFLAIGFAIGAFTLFIFNLKTRIKLRFAIKERDKLKKQLSSTVPVKAELP
ncbi:LapA family protein [Corallincola platygyrae]|uniref:Probable lipopolysaccharide assembly protein A n=1 Tax=Corallincola platygyrae TaxID=1193278 RepID=A0ABW4XKJ0_9GAMM